MHPASFGLQRLTGPEGHDSFLDSYEAECDRVHPLPTPRRRRRGNSWSVGRAGTEAVSEAGITGILVRVTGC